jgi:hypothetical protein
LKLNQNHVLPKTRTLRAVMVRMALSSTLRHEVGTQHAADDGYQAGFAATKARRYQ